MKDRMRRIAPAVYEEEATGTLHLYVSDLLRHNGYADTPANRETLLRAARTIFTESFPGTRIVEDD